MAKYLTLPSGVEAKFDDNVTYEQAIAMVQAKHPELLLTPAEREERSGFGAAFGSGWGQFAGASKVGLGKMLGIPGLQRSGERDIREAQQEFIPTSGAETQRAWEEGLFPGMGSALSQYVTEPVGGIAGRYGAPMAAATAASFLAPEVALPALLARGATGLTAAGVDLPAEFGENLIRQAEVSPGAKVNAASALGYSLIQAGLVGFGIPGLGVLTKEAKVLMGNEAASLAKQVVERKITREVAQARLNGTLRNVIEQTGVATVAGTGMMVGTEAARRAQAGQDITGPEARQAYGEMAVGAAELGPLFGLMHGVPMRRSQMRQLEGAAEKAAAKAQAERKRAERISRGEAEPPVDMFGAAQGPESPVEVRYGPDGKPVTFTREGRAETDLAAMEDLFARRSGEVRTGVDSGNLGAAARAQADRTTLGTQLGELKRLLADADPQEQIALVERMKAQIPELKNIRARVGQKIAEATARGDEAEVQQLIRQHKQIGEAIEQVEAQAQEMRIYAPGEVQQTKKVLEKRLNSLSTQIDNFTEKGAYDKLPPLVAEREQVKVDIADLDKTPIGQATKEAEAASWLALSPEKRKEAWEKRGETGGQTDMFGYNERARIEADRVWRKQYEKSIAEAAARAAKAAEAEAERIAMDKFEGSVTEASRKRREELVPKLEAAFNTLETAAQEWGKIEDLGPISPYKPTQVSKRINEINEGVLSPDTRQYLGLPSGKIDLTSPEGAEAAHKVLAHRVNLLDSKIDAARGALAKDIAKGLEITPDNIPTQAEPLLKMLNQRFYLARLRDNAAEAVARSKTPMDERRVSRLVYELTGEKTLGEKTTGGAPARSERPMEGRVAVEEAIADQEIEFNSFREDVERLHNRDFLSTSAETASGTGTRETITERADEGKKAVVDAVLRRVEGYRLDRGLPALTENEQLSLALRASELLQRTVDLANAPNKSKIRDFKNLMGRTGVEITFAGERTFTDTPGVVQRQLSKLQQEFMPVVPKPKEALTPQERVKRQYEVLLTRKADAILKAPTLAGLNAEQIRDLEAYRAKTAKFDSTEAIRSEMADLLERTEQGYTTLPAPATTRATPRNWRVYHESRLKKIEAQAEKRRADVRERATDRVLSATSAGTPEMQAVWEAQRRVVAADGKLKVISDQLAGATKPAAIKALKAQLAKAVEEEKAARASWTQLKAAERIQVAKAAPQIAAVEKRVFTAATKLARAIGSYKDLAARVRVAKGKDPARIKALTEARDEAHAKMEGLRKEFDSAVQAREALISTPEARIAKSAEAKLGVAERKTASLGVELLGMETKSPDFLAKLKKVQASLKASVEAEERGLVEAQRSATDLMRSPEMKEAKVAADNVIAAAAKYDAITAKLNAAEGKNPRYVKGLQTQQKKALDAAIQARDAWSTAKRAAKDKIDNMLAYATSEISLAERRKNEWALREARSMESLMRKADEVMDTSHLEARNVQQRIEEQKRAEALGGLPKTTRKSVEAEVKIVGSWEKTDAGKRVRSYAARNKVSKLEALNAELTSDNKRTQLETALLERAKARQELIALNAELKTLKEGTPAHTKLTKAIGAREDYLEASKEDISVTASVITHERAAVPARGGLPNEDVKIIAKAERELLHAKMARNAVAKAYKAAEAAAGQLVGFMSTHMRTGTAEGLPPKLQSQFKTRVEALNRASNAVARNKAAFEQAGIDVSGIKPESAMPLELARQIKELENSTHPLDVAMRDKTIKALKGVFSADAAMAFLSGKGQKAPVKFTEQEKIEFAKGLTKKEQREAREVTVSEEQFEGTSRYDTGPSGIFDISLRRHEGEPPAVGISEGAARGVVERVNAKLPGSLKIEVFESSEQAPVYVRQAMQAQGVSRAKGAILSDGRIIVFAKEHASRRDLEETIAHETIGHYGVDGVIGEAGMRTLATRAFAKGEAPFMELAQALGIRDQIAGIALTTRHLPVAERQMLMMRELLAHTAETRPLERSMATKVKDFFKDIVAAVRSWFKRSGLDEMSALTTGEIHKIIRDAHRALEGNRLGAVTRADGSVSFRMGSSVKSSFAAANPEVVGLAGRLTGQKRSIKDKVLSNALGLAAEIQFTDRFAGFERIAKGMKEALGGVQMMYFLRAYDTRTNMVAETALNGARKLVRAQRPDGKEEWTYGSRGTPSLKDITAELSKAKGEIGDANAVMQMFTTYMAAERAKNVGIEKLGLTEQDRPALDKALAFGRGNVAFQNARAMYEKYNHGLLDFMQETGALTAESVKALKAIKDYIGYYRERDGYVVDAETNVRIGDLKNQPFLKELLGGNSPIVDFATSALQNTAVLTDLAMRNMATKSTAFTLRDLGFIEGKIRKGDGPASPDVVRFKIHGEDHYARIKTEGTYMEDIPPSLLVKGLEGVSTTLPGALRLMQGASGLLRKGVTRMPVYAVRQAIRDPWHAMIAGGVDGAPILNSLRELKSMLGNKNAVEKALQEQGLLISQVFGPSEKANQSILRDFVAGTTHWTATMSKLDHLAIKGDAATRVAAYNSFVKQGMSHMEASLAQLDMMNFTKKGVSPSMNALSMMIPFFNAQVVGLSTLVKSMRGTTLFADRVKVQEKLLKRGALMAGLTLLYASLASDTDAYKNAKPLDRLMNIFVPIPGTGDTFKLPIPFEVGYLFKALPEAVLNVASGDEKLKDLMPAVRWMALSSVPGGANLGLPQGLKPMIETGFNFNLMTGEPIVQGRAAAVDAAYQANRSTSEVSKRIGGLFGVSPIKLDHLIRGYTGGVGAAIVALANPPLAKDEKLLQGPSDAFMVGSMFQREDGGRWVDAAYDRILEATRAQTTYKRLTEENRIEEAKAYLEKNLNKIAAASMAGQGQQALGDIAKSMRAIYVSDLPAAEKKARLRELQQSRSGLSKGYVSAFE